MTVASVDAVVEALVWAADSAAAGAVAYEAEDLTEDAGSRRALRLDCDGGGGGERCIRRRDRRTNWETHPHRDVRMVLKPAGMCPRKDSDHSADLVTSFRNEAVDCGLSLTEPTPRLSHPIPLGRRTHRRCWGIQKCLCRHLPVVL